GGAGTSFAILLGVLQIGASDTDLKLAVGISAFFMPVAIAAGVLCDFTVLARDAVVRQWTAGRAYRLVDGICATAPIGPVLATGWRVHDLSRPALIPYVLAALAVYAFIIYSAWRLAKIGDAGRNIKAVVRDNSEKDKPDASL